MTGAGKILHCLLLFAFMEIILISLGLPGMIESLGNLFEEIEASCREAGVESELSVADRGGPATGLRRPVRPDVGVLPGHQRGGLQHRRDAGPPDRVPEGPRQPLTRAAPAARSSPARAGIIRVS